MATSRERLESPSEAYSRSAPRVGPRIASSRMGISSTTSSVLGEGGLVAHRRETQYRNRCWLADPDCTRKSVGLGPPPSHELTPEHAERAGSDPSLRGTSHAN
jgi:hypothetical protein